MEFHGNCKRIFQVLAPLSFRVSGQARVLPLPPVRCGRVVCLVGQPPVPAAWASVADKRRPRV